MNREQLFYRDNFNKFNYQYKPNTLNLNFNSDKIIVLICFNLILSISLFKI